MPLPPFFNVGKDTGFPPPSFILQPISGIMFPEMAKHLPVFFLILAFLALGAGLIATTPGFVEMDEVCHYLQARYAPQHPFLFASIWARPLFVLLYTLPAQLPFSLTRVFTLLMATLVGLQAYRMARMRDIAWPSLAFLFTVTQPLFIQQSYTVMTELCLGLLLVLGLMHWENRHRNLSCLFISLTPLSRPEGFFLGPLWFLLVWLDHRSTITTRLKRTGLLLAGLLLWAVLSWLGTGNPLWFVKNFPWGYHGRWGSATILDYVLRLPRFASPPILILALLGVFVIRRYRLGLAFFLSLFILILHSLLWTGGYFGSAGYLRYLVPISLLLGLCAAAGFSALMAGSRRLGYLLTRRTSGLWAPVSGLMILALSAWSYSLHLRSHPIPVPQERPEVQVYREMQVYFNTRTLDPLAPRPLIFCSDFHFYFLTLRDPWDMGMTNREYLRFIRNDQLMLPDLLKALPPGSYVLYDRDWMGSYSGLTEKKLIGLGYEPVPDQPLGEVGNGNFIYLFRKPLPSPASN
jgi:hypothetical protein